MALYKRGDSAPGRPAGISRFELDYKAFCDLQRTVGVRVVADSPQSRFACRLALHLPEVAERIDEDDFGHLHLEVGTLKLATRDAIAVRDWGVVARHFAFVSAALRGAGPELRDALMVSYLGNLLYGETSLNCAGARVLLPGNLAAALETVERHYENLAP